MREREVFIYEAADLSKPLCRIPIGQGTGLLIPYYDADTDLFYLTAKVWNISHARATLLLIGRLLKLL